MIRLSRLGKKKHSFFRVIISEKARDTQGRYLELLGNYDPHTNKAELNADRIKYWLERGAQPSGTVHNLLIDQHIITGEKIKVAQIKKKKEEAPAAGAQPAAAETKPATPAEQVTAPAETKPAETAPEPAAPAPAATEPTPAQPDEKK